MQGAGNTTEWSQDGPTRVMVNLYVRSFEKIDDVKMEFSVQEYSFDIDCHEWIAVITPSANVPNGWCRSQWFVLVADVIVRTLQITFRQQWNDNRLAFNRQDSREVLGNTWERPSAADVQK